ncbi:MAG: heme exporter protein CcmD [Geminicoccaceae bacterium]
MSEFLAMGGYGAYVWAAYGVTALFLLLLFLWSWFGARARETELEQMQKLARAERRGTLATSTAAVQGSPGDGGAGAPSLATGDSGGAGG